MGPRPIHDRARLLFGARRNVELDLEEVERYGIDSHGDPDYVSIYGKRPAEWYAAGVRLLGRTVVECTRDALADAIATDIAAVVALAPGPPGALVVDPFAGSANTLWWILRRLPGATGYGFEDDPGVFRRTARNIAALAAPIELLNVDYLAGLDAISVPMDRTIVVFVAPPWGEALDPITGLDLRRTAPPIPEIVDVLVVRFPGNPLLVAIQVFERLDPLSQDEVERRFDWTGLRVYDLDPTPQRHGILLGTRGWIPR
ncbi:MAG: hypothetical protein QOE66_2630 [Chloroflexota bacterium]|nr:hypothetical protein [Chloroflexota bacterium]